MTTFSCPRCCKLSAGFPCQCTSQRAEPIMTWREVVALVLLCAISFALLVFSDPGVQP